MVRSCALGLGALLLLIGDSRPVNAAFAPRYGLRLEAGAEQDTNPTRVEKIRGEVDPAGAPLVPSALSRFVGTIDIAAPVAARQAFALSVSVAGKRFFNETAASIEDVLIAQAQASHTVTLGAGTALALTGAYYDVFQPATRFARDFRSTSPALRLDQALAGGQLSLGVGHRWFSYKVFPDYDFVGPTAALGYRRVIAARAEPGSADWDWSTGLSIEARRFAGLACKDSDNCPPAPGTAAVDHRNRFWTAQLELNRTGAFLFGGGAAAQLNQSNGFGESLLRGLFHLRAVFMLPFELALSARAEAILTHYRESIPLQRHAMTGVPLVTIEDEGRSTVRVELVRPVGSHWEVGARYTLYSNALLRPIDVSYRRQTALLFVAFALEQ